MLSYKTYSASISKRFYFWISQIDHSVEGHMDEDVSMPLLNPSSLSRPEVSNILLPAGSPNQNFTIQFSIR